MEYIIEQNIEAEDIVRNVKQKDWFKGGRKMKIKNILRCPYCGAEVASEAKTRDCYKCETKMELLRVDVKK